MAGEVKSKRINARVPPTLLDRLDYVLRNNMTINNVSEAVCAALGGWLDAQEEQLRVSGVLPKKARP